MVQWMFGQRPRLLLILFFACLTGCAVPTAVDPLPYFQHDRRDSNAVGTLELCRLYSRYGFADGSCGSADWNVRLFNAEDLASEEIKSARNELQNSILSVSTSMCSEFKQRLEVSSGGQLLRSEALALLFSAGAALGGSEEIARGLAALAGASTGFGRLIEDGYINDMEVAQQGIELARSRVFRQINGGQEKNLLEYPLARAVNDALRYHAVCNVAEGKSEASRSLNEEFSELAPNSPDSPS